MSERQKRILGILAAHGSQHVDRLANRIDCSWDSAYKTLLKLRKRGYVRTGEKTVHSPHRRPYVLWKITVAGKEAVAAEERK